MNNFCKLNASRFARLPVVFFTILLASCGGDSSDTTAAVATLAPLSGEALGIRNDIVITFDEAMDPDSLTLGGNLGAISDGGTLNVDNTVLTIAPDQMGAWESGVQSLTLSINDASGNTTYVNATFVIDFVLNTFQAAGIVIGQTDFTGNAANRGATAAADTLYNPVGDPMVIDGRLWVVDASNHRVLGYDGIPSTDGASAIWVIGQSSFTASGGGASDTMLLSPFDLAYDQSTFFVNDAGNNRVLAYDGVPLSPPGTASHVVGQADMSTTVSGCSESYFQNPDAITTVAGKFILSDWANSRVLIWNSLPTGANNIPPDLVLGQSDFTHCTHRDDDQNGVAELDPTARTLSYPSGVWSDGERLLVADTYNSRVLIWNSFPTSSFQPADVVIGHGDFVHETARDDDQDGITDVYPTARTLASPTRVWSNGLQIIVTDQDNHRVLLWNDFPTENFQPADVVLGQADFAGKQANDDDQNNSEDASPTARTFKLPFGVGVYRNKLLVSDTNNHRMLAFESH